MTGNLLLDWAALAVSLNNTILLLWLALTILLNAEKRTWGIWLTSAALLAASAFFLSHTAILGHELDFTSVGLDFWWHVGWVPVIALPFSWYGVTLWYAGFFDARSAELRQRHRIWFTLAALLSLALAALLAFANPLPSIRDLANLQINRTPTIAGTPVILPLFVADILLCVLLSLDALMHPAPSPRMMGDLARQRAQPWLITAAIDLLLVGALVAIVMTWVIATAAQGLIVDRTIILTIGIFDLVIAVLIAISILLVGQAVTLYEVFTGKTLPRRGLVRQWRIAIILALGYGIVIGWSMTVQLKPVYAILLATMLLTIFFALLAWRTYIERDSFVRHLRPFVTSQHLYDQLLAATPTQVDVQLPFRALCRDVLNARTALLTALGPLAPLVPPLTYPNAQTATPPIDATQFDSPQTMCVQIDATHWAIPLWSERGLSGVLTLGEKIDGGMYAQEEIEIARATGERLIDTRASAELARRLMELQRQRWTETQLLDRQTRRILHDDVLPQLHAALLMVGNTNPDAIEALTNAHRQISNLVRDLPATHAPNIARVGLLAALHHAVESEWYSAFDSVTWETAPGAEQQAQTFSPLAAETIFYATREAIRNAARHGRPAQAKRAFNLKIKIECGWRIIVEDDGVGVSHITVANGHGLALHSALLAVLGGTLGIAPRTGGGTRVTIDLPLKTQT